MTDQLGREEIYTYYTDSEITPAYQDGSNVQYTYDLAGRVLTVTDTLTGAISYTYNDFGCTTCSGHGMDRIAQEVTPLGTIDYTYDKLGRRKTMQVAGQNIVNYDYYDNGVPQAVRQIIGGIERKFKFSYDDANRRNALEYFQNGAATPNMKTTYGYDNASRLLNLQHLDSMNSQLETLNYTYDPNGNRTSMSRPSVTLPTPNSASNINYNEANQMLTFNDKNITYDNNGNLLTSTNSSGTTNYTWDARNRLTAIISPSLTAAFKYDTLGRRIEKTINSTVTKYLYDGVDIIQEKNQSGAVTANYIRTLDIDDPLARISADSAVRHYVKDALGSIIALTDDSGVVKTTYSYDPFGNTTVSGEASDNPFQYTGRENDGTGLYYYRARYYSPELQRFISEDPILKPGNPNVPCFMSRLLKKPDMFNAYNYVRNNPVLRTDPFGLADCQTNCELFCNATGCALGCGFICGANPICWVGCAAGCGILCHMQCTAICNPPPCK